MTDAAKTMFARRAAGPDTPIKLGVAVVIRNAQDQILLEKRSDCGLWGLPGGGVEPGESITQTAVRETLEETGLNVNVCRLTGVYSEPEGRVVTYPNNGDVRHLIDVVVEAIIISGELRLSSESEALQFFDLDALPQDMVPPSRVTVQDVIQGFTGVLR